MIKKILGLGLIAALSMCMVSCIEDEYESQAFVRFAWPTVEQAGMWYIFANEKDIEGWYKDVWNDVANIDDEDFVFRSSFNPNRHGGISSPIYSDPTENINNVTIFARGPGNPSGKHPNNGRYFHVYPGTYIAVCSVDDPNFDVTWDIIADYTIRTFTSTSSSIEDEERLFEIAFNLTKFLDAPDTLASTRYGWYGLEPGTFDNPTLNKRRPANKVFSERITKAGGTMDITYHAFARPRKK